MLSLHVLSSGSKGNSALVVDASSGEGILIDCGICRRDLIARSEQAEVDLTKLRAVLITHDHSDHIGNLGVVLRALRKFEGAERALYALPEIIESRKEIFDAREYINVENIDLKNRIQIGNISVTVFETSHDAIASCGFRFDSVDGDSIGFMTDTGIVTDEALECLSGLRICAIESNHDEDMLANGPYPYYLKQRILSDSGHLSNDQAAEALRELAHSGLEHVVGMHLSHQNNLPSIARERLERELLDLGCGAQVHIASQTSLVSVF